jgi:hypothetical protein
MTHSVRTLLLNRLQTDMVVNQSKLPAPEQAMLALMLSQEQKLVRDCSGHWNHVGSKRQAYRVGTPPARFQFGFTDKTIRRLIEAGRARETKYDDRGEATEVEWVAI